MKIIPKAPLFRDPIFDGAADPVIIWNSQEETWWILYTNRRAFSPNSGVAYVHGTDIGIASSSDEGKNWNYRGTVRGLEFEPGRNTFWAPEIIEKDGIYHMYVSYVRGIPTNWNCGRNIIHYTSQNLWDWKFENILNLSSDRVIDAAIYQIGEKEWKMWYKDERNNSFSYAATSEDLYQWRVLGPEITDVAHEGPNVIYFENSYWMITDPWEGLGVYQSDDATHWNRRGNILTEPGIRIDDGTCANHADVLVHKNHAYIFYFTHPEVNLADRKNPEFIWEYCHRRSSIQVAELIVQNGKLICDRNNVEIDLSWN